MLLAVLPVPGGFSAQCARRPRPRPRRPRRLAELVGAAVGRGSLGAVGEEVGAAVVGEAVGARVGDAVGASVGDAVGAPVGALVGASVAGSCESEQTSNASSAKWIG